MTDILRALAESRLHAELWRNMAWVFSEAILQWDQMTGDERARVRAKVAELTPNVLQLPWEEATPPGQAPQWAIDLLDKEANNE